MTDLGGLGVSWPFPRIVFAQLIAAVHQAGASFILVDLTFFEESDDSGQDPLLAAICAAAPSVVLARTHERSPVFWDDEFTAGHAQFFKKPRTGLVEFTTDKDGVARSYVALGSLAAAGFDPPASASGGLIRWHGNLDDLHAKKVPIISASQFIVAGKKLCEQLVLSAPDLDPESIAAALDKIPLLTGPTAAMVHGKIVFIGSNASGTFDLKPLPVGGDSEPGVLYHWTAWTNLAAGGFITAVPGTGILFGALLIAGAIIWAGRRHQALIAPVAAATVLGLILLFGSYAALSAGWFFAPATPLAAIVLTLLGVTIESYWLEGVRKREIQSMFGAYVDPTVVAQLVRDPEAINLRGERREATVFFSDLVGFTDLSEKLKDQPEEMVEVVNAYLEVTSECLLNYGAYVDKYIGDAVMAVFGAPQAQADHAFAACQAALEARQALETVNARYAASIGQPLGVRIGLATGEMIMGNVGSSRKKNYTVMGDTVNLSSRLEGANKEFGTQILLADATAKLVAGRLATRPLTRLRVKGKHEAIVVHELIGTLKSLSPTQRDFLAAYLPGYAHFTARRFAEAKADFGRALAARPDDDVTRELLEQSTTFAQVPPPPDWQPILTLKSK